MRTLWRLLKWLVGTAVAAAVGVLITAAIGKVAWGWDLIVKLRDLALRFGMTALVALLAGLVIVLGVKFVVERRRRMRADARSLPLIAVSSPVPGPRIGVRTSYLGAIWHWEVPLLEPWLRPPNDPANHDYRNLQQDGDPRCSQCGSELEEEELNRPGFEGGSVSWRMES